MRRIVMFNHVSADGHFSAPDGNLHWVRPDEELDRAGAASMPGADTILFGRRTYDLFESFWPSALNDSPTAPDPHDAGRQSAAVRAIGMWIDEATKLVFSRTRTAATWRNSRILPDLDPHAIDVMKQQPGKDIMLFGSGSIVSQLTQHGLIDEYQFVVSPILLGQGQPLLNHVTTSIKLVLVDATTYPSGNVVLRYTPAP